ncbi:hypothetical protein H3143_01470 [Mycoplasma tullyi]|uniref:Uncharacterized protein n=1 Tax=Mycoplasma tullyi TaxID=1612150 RepID=A0A7D7UBA2_9MOLU|nr:hypothetical protein [Mycoplasma tullyi]QMT98785.1 hypothetical protein H3143_01470 [Mycoplasma tullyi]
MNKEETKLISGSVTTVIRYTTQPKGGYLPFKMFKEHSLVPDEFLSHKLENIHPTLMGLVVDYLTRYMLSSDPNGSFKISLMGAILINQLDDFWYLLDQINESLDDDVIIAAIRLTTFDHYYRQGITEYEDPFILDPNDISINHVREMVNRSLNFINSQKELVSYGTTFEKGLTDKIISGDCDFITEDTLWDFKVSVNPVYYSKQTLQIFVYWRLGLHSIHKDMFEKIKYLGFYNPRYNKYHTVAVGDIEQGIIELVEKEVIGY